VCWREGVVDRREPCVLIIFSVHIGRKRSISTSTVLVLSFQHWTLNHLSFHRKPACRYEFLLFSEVFALSSFLAGSRRQLAWLRSH